MAAQCCSQAEACDVLDTCGALDECVKGCTSPQCVLDCYRVPGSITDPGYSAYLTMRSCANLNCTDDCGVGQDWSCTGGYAASGEIGISGQQFARPCLRAARRNLNDRQSVLHVWAVDEPVARYGQAS